RGPRGPKPVGRPRKGPRRRGSNKPGRTRRPQRRRRKGEAARRDRTESSEAARGGGGQGACRGRRVSGPAREEIERGGDPMRERFHLRRDERGMSLVFVAVGFMAMLSATTLAIDVGMFMNSRSQAQNAADAGAHAGAVALVFNSFTDRTSTGPAVTSAISAALANQVGGQAVSVLPEDVTFPNDPTGQPTRVAVHVFRTAARTNPVPTLMGTFFGVQQVDIDAIATAEASAANAMTCVKPFM